VAYRNVGALAVREWGVSSDPGILLWPGLGFDSTYFLASASLLSGRIVAVDPPGFGRSPAPTVYSYEQLVESAVEVVRVCDCRAMVGHSIGGDVALGVAAEPPSNLGAVVLIDGGYLEPADAVELGMPDGSDRDEMVAYMREQQARFADWEAARTAFATLLDPEELTPAFEAAFRETFIELDGELRQAASPELLTDALMPFMTDPFDVRALASSIAIPTLLIAAGLPTRVRSTKQQAWERFAAMSPLIDVHVAEGWGHNPLLTASNDCAAVINAWLSRQLPA
jgi:pimeloyl-ACP methyl ester carboxylesterase